VTRICDARRTEPIMVEDNGLVLWKLNCYDEEPKFLLQGLKFTKLFVYVSYACVYCLVT